MAKNPPEMQETQVPSPGWEDSLEKGMATLFRDLPCSSDGKESVCNAGDPSSIPGSGRSSGEGNGNPLLRFLPWQTDSLPLSHPLMVSHCSFNGQFHNV